MDKHEVAAVLNEIGMLLELKGENFFKYKAYYEGARAVELMDEELQSVVSEGRLKAIKGIGEALAQKITELVLTGSLQYHEKLKESVPSGLAELLRIQGLGGKKILAMYNSLGISSVEELKKACQEGKLASLPGFGEKTQAKILEGIENLGKYAGQFYFYQAETLAIRLSEYLKASGLVSECSIAGSLRRKKEIVKDIDIVAAANTNPGEVMKLFSANPYVAQVSIGGEKKASVVLKGGIPADLRVVSQEEYPYTLHHFTGSKEHNTALRHIARQKGVKMNEYGLFKDDELIRCKNEEEIFRFFGMDYIPPELRENSGELEAALNGTLPALVEESDIQGVFHVHTAYSDGTNSIKELAEACRGAGYTYLGIADHSRSAYYAGGLKEEDIKRQHEEIDKLNRTFTDFIILKGIELDILPDGSLDYNEEILAGFDFTIASVHSGFKMEEEKMTERVVRAIGSRHVTMLGHPTGRVLLSREPYRINLAEVFKAAAQKNVVVEINASPHRLDLDWRYCRAAKEAGCRFAISPDAHALDEIYDVRYGVFNARKGWLTKKDIINCEDRNSICNFLKI